MKKYNYWAFYSSIFLLIVSIHAYYASINQIWSIAPPVLVLFFLSLLTLIIGLLGFRDKTSKAARIRSWLSIFFSCILSVTLILGLFVNVYAKEAIVTSQSPGSTYTIEFYTLNGGAASSLSVQGVLNGPLWFKKNLYHDNNQDSIEVEWQSEHVVSINNHLLDLSKGNTFRD
ncbi:hypothetical protein DES38_104216 [Streptohalobacillus salinus]|uniref:Uncharacterized protein n=1 Tax=Streptohalobacillus salinus TaxID=621096 RepID=A0A2V3WCR0_9BACI|nr:DUF5412 family protein [Streptohalobacillus salinus]PXW91782.1 hypothetical protein DES38_104216 [Streptohalobacillus salinus]